MAIVEIIYSGDLRTEITHILSGTKTITDAPLGSQGKGEALSPTDMVAAALGSCMLTVMGISARTHGIDMDGTTCAVTKVMYVDPSRIGEISVKFSFKKTYTEKEEKILQAACMACPVHYSLNPDLIKTVDFGW